MAERTPAAVFHVGSFIAEELAARNLTLVALANTTAWRIRSLQPVVDGTARLSARDASLLGVLTGISAEFWMHLQAQYDKGAPRG